MLSIYTNYDWKVIVNNEHLKLILNNQLTEENSADYVQV